MSTACLVTAATYLDVDEETLDGAERLVDDEVKLQLLRQLQLVVQDDLRRLLLVAAHVVDKVVDGDVELLNLARQVHARHSAGDGNAAQEGKCVSRRALGSKG